MATEIIPWQERRVELLEEKIAELEARLEILDRDFAGFMAEYQKSIPNAE